jgi:hypothetical protein
VAKNREVTNLLSALAGPTDEMKSVRLVRGKVVTVQDIISPMYVTATIGGGEEAVQMSYFDSYSPSVDDEVYILVNGGDKIVLGKLA